jgi:UDP-GlcNAc3NAcA epimerase
MKKIITVIGARPQFIKAATVSRILRQATIHHESIIHTGQHYDHNMSQIFFDELEIPEVSYHLGIGSGEQGHQTGEMLSAIEKVLMKEKPDYLLIYGDTNSTLAGALAAAKLHIPIAHVEAGLRSYNRKMPEEINRILADQLSDILFTPTKQAVINLTKEGYDKARIIEVGDVMYDAALYYADKAEKFSNILSKLHYQKSDYILATIHRAENTNDSEQLTNIFSALERISKTLPVVMPLHPRTRKLLEQYTPHFLLQSHIHVIEPVGFLDMVMLEKNAAAIITDSGGVQKEAFFYHVPCITLRSETEWIETVELGWNNLIDPQNPDLIHDQVIQTLGTKGLVNHFPYGEGNAAHLIVQNLIQGEF